MDRETRIPATGAASAVLLVAVAGVGLVAPALGDRSDSPGGGELVVESSRSGATKGAGGDAQGPKFFRIEVSVDGEFTADYGEDPGPNQSDYSGEASTSYSSDFVSVARYRPDERFVGKFKNTKARATVREATSVVSHFPGSPDTEFTCDNGQGSQTGGTLAPSSGDTVQLGGWVRNIGLVQIEPGNGTMGAYYNTAGPYFESLCFDAGHEPVNHYLINPETSDVLEADGSTISSCCVIPRGAFNPNFDRGYEATYSRDVSYDSGPGPHSGPFPNHPGADFPHEFDGTSSASVEITELSEKKAKRLRKKIRNLGEDQN